MAERHCKGWVEKMSEKIIQFERKERQLQVIWIKGKIVQGLMRMVERRVIETKGKSDKNITKPKERERSSQLIHSHHPGYPGPQQSPHGWVGLPGGGDAGCGGAARSPPATRTCCHPGHCPAPGRG